MRQKQVVSTLVSVYFASPRLRHEIKANSINIQAVDLEICSILFF